MQKVRTEFELSFGLEENSPFNLQNQWIQANLSLSEIEKIDEALSNRARMRINNLLCSARRKHVYKYSSCQISTLSIKNRKATGVISNEFEKIDPAMNNPSSCIAFLMRDAFRDLGFGLFHCGGKIISQDTEYSSDAIGNFSSATVDLRDVYLGNTPVTTSTTGRVVGGMFDMGGKHEDPEDTDSGEVEAGIKCEIETEQCCDCDDDTPPEYVEGYVKGLEIRWIH